MHARPRSGIGGGRGPGEILLRPSVRPGTRQALDQIGFSGQEKIKNENPVIWAFNFPFPGQPRTAPPAGARIRRPKKNEKAILRCGQTLLPELGGRFRNRLQRPPGAFASTAPYNTVPVRDTSH